MNTKEANLELTTRSTYWLENIHDKRKRYGFLYAILGEISESKLDVEIERYADFSEYWFTFRDLTRAVDCGDNVDQRILEELGDITIMFSVDRNDKRRLHITCPKEGEIMLSLSTGEFSITMNLNDATVRINYEGENYVCSLMNESVFIKRLRSSLIRISLKKF